MEDIQRRTPRAVPIVVSAGLSVGVFCGLLFGLGTGTPVVTAATQPAPKPEPAPRVEVADVPDRTPTPAPPAAPQPPPRIKVTVDVTPASAASNAKISIDGQPLTGNSIEVPKESKSVRLSIAAPGFRPIDKSIELEGADTTIKQEMAKRGNASASAVKRPSAPTPVPTASPPRRGGGFIDL